MMRRVLTAAAVAGLVSMNSRDAAAQTAQDIAAAGAIGSTPVGQLTPLFVPGPKAGKGRNVAARYAHFSPSGGGDGANSFGGTFSSKLGMNATLSGTAAYTQIGCPSGASCDNTIGLGADVNSVIWNNEAAKSTTLMSINVNPSFGYGKNGDVNFLSAVVQVPIGMSMEQASKARIGGYVVPGFGWGRTSVTGASESGTRPMVGAGAFWMSPAGWGLHASYGKVIIDNGGNAFGLGFTWNMN